MPDTDAHDEKLSTDEDADGSDDGEQKKVDPEDKSDPDVYVDRDKIDFDPDDGLLSGTAIDGGTDIPGPHENVNDVEPDSDDFDDDSDDDSDDSEAGSEDSGSEDGSDKDGSAEDGSDD